MGSQNLGNGKCLLSGYVGTCMHTNTHTEVCVSCIEQKFWKKI